MWWINDLKRPTRDCEDRPVVYAPPPLPPDMVLDTRTDEDDPPARGILIINLGLNN